MTWTTTGFQTTNRAKIVDNLKRIRHHASIGLICGNNEIEVAGRLLGRVPDPDVREVLLRAAVISSLYRAARRRTLPRIVYWPSSPSNGGATFENPNAE
ncbi:MAG: hypothetical protein MZW92_02765 [Comamonadaceae bacterium]|nr:hypothetical protein [Comamonadaceae bacterium]